ncbi:MAG: putative membrane protein (TolA-like) of the Tol-Pal [Planctomycetota bacterium]|nr:MAG: putative membrane protein (TolA-like) of the Tol-Pal [Planctomycetota bacterium]
MRCPGLETLARLSEGRLPAPERERLLEHLADCDECRQIAVGMGSGEKATTRRISKPANRLPWGVAAAIAAAALIGFAFWRTHHGAAPDARAGRRQESASSSDPVKTVEPATPAQPKPAPPKPEPVKPEPPKPEPPKPEPVKPEPPQPEPPNPEPPKPPPDRTEPPKPDPVKPPPKVRDASVLASVRLLDVTGEIAASKKRVANAAILHDTLTASTNAAFRVDGDTVFLKRGTVASLGRDADTMCLFVHVGEALVESSGARWQFADDATTLTGEAFVTPAGVVLASELESKESAKRLGPFAAFRPRHKTWLFEDFADKPVGFEAGVAQGGVVAAWVPLPRPAPWSRRLSVRLRVRTNAPSVQVGMRFQTRDVSLPWAAIVPVKKGDWQELVVNGKQFGGGPTGAKEPAAGESLVELGFSIDPLLVGGKAGPTLEIDDVVLTDPETEGERK